MGLTDEHVIPFGLGGILQIHRGSCDICREKTQKFEGIVLRGEMQRVRALLALPSRSRHSTSPTTSEVFFSGRDGAEGTDISVDEAPLFLSFPVFKPAGLLCGRATPDLGIEGVFSGIYGIDAEAFLRKHKATGAKFEGSMQPVAFAQLVAKVAFCYAHAESIIPYIEGTQELVGAMLDRPEDLGLYVGTAPLPYVKFDGFLHRIQFDWSSNGFIYGSVQLFADIGAPAYNVVLGRSTLRQWRNIRLKMAKNLADCKRSK